ncbi:MAG: hypothetical protein AAFY64_03530, partial [Pseudomonadota bacterium]
MLPGGSTPKRDCLTPTPFRAARAISLCVVIGIFATVFSVSSSVVAPSVANAEAIRFSSPREAYAQGYAAFIREQYEIAVPALEAAHQGGIVQAPFLLAQIYSGDHPAYINHARAYYLHKWIVNKYKGVVVSKSSPLSMKLAKSITALAKYIIHGLPEADVAADRDRALRLLRHAAMHLNEEDAQFELARLTIHGDADDKARRNALYLLQRLTRKRHGGALAIMAQLYWKGRYVQRRQAYALLLIHSALRNAPPTERIWIEEIYQSIFCGAPKDVREFAAGQVAGWDRRMGERKRRRAFDLNRSKTNTLSDFRGPVRT